MEKLAVFVSAFAEVCALAINTFAMFKAYDIMGGLLYCTIGCVSGVLTILALVVTILAWKYYD